VYLVTIDREFSDVPVTASYLFPPHLAGFEAYFGSLSAVTLTFDLLTSKSNQHIYEPIYTYDQNWAKVPSLVFEIWCSQGFRDAYTPFIGVGSSVTFIHYFGRIVTPPLHLSDW